MFRSLATVAILVALAGNGQLIHNWPMSCGQHTNIHQSVQCLIAHQVKDHCFMVNVRVPDRSTANPVTPPSFTSTPVRQHMYIFTAIYPHIMSTQRCFLICIHTYIHTRTYNYSLYTTIHITSLLTPMPSLRHIFSTYLVHLSIYQLQASLPYYIYYQYKATLNLHCGSLNPEGDQSKHPVMYRHTHTCTPVCGVLLKLGAEKWEIRNQAILY